MTYERPILTADVVVLTVIEGRLSVGLMERADPAEPFAGRLALVGGYVRTDADADAEAAARRVLRDKAGIEGVYMEQLMTFSGPGRDPRGWSASVAYIAPAPMPDLEEARGLVFLPVEEAVGLAFDHDAIIAAAADRMRTKGSYSTLPARLAGREFSLAELRSAYMVATKLTPDPSSFRKKMLELDILEECGERREASRRPTALWRLKDEIAVFDRRI